LAALQAQIDALKKQYDMAKDKIARKQKRREERRLQRRSDHDKKKHKKQKSSRGGNLSADSEIRKSAISDLPTLTTADQLMITEAINGFGPDNISEVITIIKQGMNLPTDGAEEIELDINTMDRRTQYRLYKLVQRVKNPRKISKTGLEVRIKSIYS
jgi:hypothetical protein